MVIFGRLKSQFKTQPASEFCYDHQVSRKSEGKNRYHDHTITSRAGQLRSQLAKKFYRVIKSCRVITFEVWHHDAKSHLSLSILVFVKKIMKTAVEINLGSLLLLTVIKFTILVLASAPPPSILRQIAPWSGIAPALQKTNK